VLPLLSTLSTLPLRDSTRVLGTLILGAPGAGKTILESLLLLCDLLRGLPGVVLDPLGTLSKAFLFRLLWFLSEFPKGEDELLWQRLRYIPVGGDSITPFPLYAQRQGESLAEGAQRLITVLERSNPQLVTGSALTWPATRRLAVNAGMLLTALGFQLTKVEDLLFNTLEWEKAGRFDAAVKRNPQAKDAVSYFRNSYLPLPRSEKSRLAGTFLDQVFMLTYDPKLRAVFSGSSTPGIDWEEVEANRQLVILNFKDVTDPTARSFAMHWIFESLYPHLKARGRRNTPFVVTVDEFDNLAAAWTAENKPLAELFDEFLAQYMRNNRVFLSIAFQSIDQVDERLRQTIFRLGTIITGRAGLMREARVIADQLVRNDIYRVKHHRKVWGKVDPPPFPYRYTSSDYDYLWRHYPNFPYYVLDTEPEFMSLEDQQEEAAGTITQLRALEFLCRPAVREGEVSQEVVPLAIADAITDPDTGEYQFPDQDQDAALTAQIQHELAARFGVPMEEILKEQETRLTQGMLQKPQQIHPASELDQRQLSSLPKKISLSEDGSREDSAQPAPRNTRETHSRPTLDDKEQAFLTLLITHPDMPASVFSKELQIRADRATKIRESLIEQGFMQEVAMRPAGTGAGRPFKWLMPTMQAFAMLGIEPPTGRGGVLHRHVQHVVADGATTKGFLVT
jgi:hypothetical protein